MKKTVNEPIDERQKMINNQAVANGFVFLSLCLIIAMVVRIFTEESLGWEFLALLGASVVIIISRRVLGDVEQPKDLRGNPLPTGNTRCERKARSRHYAHDSLIFAAACTVMDILLFATGSDGTDIELTELLLPNLGKGAAVALTAVSTFAITFGISFLFDYLIGECFTVKRYNRMLAQLDEDA